MVVLLVVAVVFVLVVVAALVVALRASRRARRLRHLDDPLAPRATAAGERELGTARAQASRPDGTTASGGGPG